MMNYVDSNKQPHILGITAEKVTETININRDDFHSSTVSLEETPFLGAITNTEQGMMQFIEIENLLPDDVQAMLFQDADIKFHTGS